MVDAAKEEQHSFKECKKGIDGIFFQASQSWPAPSMSFSKDKYSKE